jgi:hypothetical protein
MSVNMIDLATLIQALSVISACWAIIAGIDAWKREFIGKRRIELAEQTLAKFYEVKDAIAFIRGIFIRSGEGTTRQRAANETSEESELLDRGFVAHERYAKRESAFADFNVLKYRFMASFGKQHEEIFTETYRAVNSVFLAAETLARSYWGVHGRFVPDQERHFKDMQTFESILWSSGEDDKIVVKLNEMQKKLEEATAPCFEEGITSYKLLTKKWRF